MENLNVILSLLFFLGLGSGAIHYVGSKKARARVYAEAKKERGEGII